jgi:hypothetical protein
MRDVKLGESIDAASSANHTFITTSIGKENYIVDSFYGLYGKAKVNGNKINVVDVVYGRKEYTERVSNMLVEMSEDEYLQRFYKTRNEGGREALSIGRVINSFRRRLTVEYLTDTEQLASFISFNEGFALIEKGYSSHRTCCLRAPVSKEGKWQTEEGELYFFSSSNKGWTLDQHENISDEIILPIDLAKKYATNLRQSIINSGRKSSPYYIVTNDLRKYFSDKGFSETGEIIKNNGVDKIQHKQLNEQLLKYLPSNISSNILPHVNQLAAFYSQRNKLKTSNPQWPHIFSPKEHSDCIQKYSNLVSDDLVIRGKLVYQDIIATAGFITNAKKNNQILQQHIHEENAITHFRDMLSERKKSIDIFNEDIDLALFQKEHPVGSITATSEEIEFFYRRKLFTDLVAFSITDRSLEVRDKRKGLEMLLAE